MSYRCMSCNYTESKYFPNGRCLRCNSYNVKSEKEPVGYKQYRKHLSLKKVLLFIGLVALLAYGVWYRYQNTPLSLDEEYHLLQQQSAN